MCGKACLKARSLPPLASTRDLIPLAAPWIEHAAWLSLLRKPRVVSQTVRGRENGEGLVPSVCWFQAFCLTISHARKGGSSGWCWHCALPTRSGLPSFRAPVTRTRPPTPLACALPSLGRGVPQWWPKSRCFCLYEGLRLKAGKWHCPPCGTVPGDWA